jgi:lipoate-protein ligase A
MGALRVIRDGPLPGAVNMDRDRTLLARQKPDDPPVLRLYRWSPPAVSLGRNQPAGAFDAVRIADRGLDLVRRPTGGRAILHAAELTYAVVGASPSPLFGATLHTTYTRINQALLAFLAHLGIAAEVSAGESRTEARGAVCFQSAGQHEVRVGGRKLIGSAQRRTAGIFLQHGSILTGPEHADLADCMPSKAGAEGRRESLLAATTDLGRLLKRRITDTDFEELETRFVAAAARSFGLEPVPF